jgi:hypothetical protein
MSSAGFEGTRPVFFAQRKKLRRTAARCPIVSPLESPQWRSRKSISQQPPHRARGEPEKGGGFYLVEERLALSRLSGHSP